MFGSTRTVENNAKQASKVLVGCCIAIAWAMVATVNSHEPDDGGNLNNRKNELCFSISLDSEHIDAYDEQTKKCHKYRSR